MSLHDSIRRPRRRAVLAGASVLLLVGGGTAYGYFTSQGTNTASTTVGSVSPWTVTGPTGSGNPTTSTGVMLPGSGTLTVSYAALNPSNGNQYLNSAVVTISADTNGNVLNTAAANAPVTGCLASWFTVSNTGAPAPQNVAGGAHVAGSATVSMSKPNVSQNACQGVSPQVTITVN